MTEIARMRGLLDELKRVNGELEAPTKLDGFRATVSKVWNESFFIGPKYVADRCAAVLKECGERLTSALKIKMERLLKALRRVEHAESEYTGGSHLTHLEKEATVKTRVRLVAWVHVSMQNEVFEAVQGLTNTEGKDVPWDPMYDKLKEMKSDALAVALAAFLKAMKIYRQRHNEEFTNPFDEYENRTFPDEAARLDKKKVG